jgi:hypothetical protein
MDLIDRIAAMGVYFDEPSFAIIDGAHCRVVRLMAPWYSDTPVATGAHSDSNEATLSALVSTPILWATLWPRPDREQGGLEA